MAFLRLGWSWHRPNDFNTPEERPLKDTFGSLQKSLHFPYVGLRFDGTFQMTGTLAPIPFTVVSAAASPFVPGDPFNLYRVATNQVQVPQEFDTWMLIGHACAETAGGAAADLMTFGFRINQVNADWFQHPTGNPASRSVSSIMSPVRKGDTVDVGAATTNLAEDLIDAEAWMYFMPLG
jgi:hypothetical protein